MLEDHSLDFRINVMNMLYALISSVNINEDVILVYNPKVLLI